MALNEELITHIDSTQSGSRQSYVCGHCGKDVSGRIIAEYPGSPHVKWLICTSCSKGSVLHLGEPMLPLNPPGDKLEGLPSEINSAYEEARRCFSVSSHTACELMCRKILMHIAVDKGESEGKKFVEYIDYLEKKGYITPSIKPWADIIRENGNAATHKIISPSKERAEHTLLFTMELLRIMYEMEHIANKYNSKQQK